MNKQRIQGAIDQAVGGAKSQIGKLTGDLGTQVEGAAQQVKGHAESAVGELKDNLATPPPSNVPHSGSILRR